jgi:hypothetical protein
LSGHRGRYGSNSIYSRLIEGMNASTPIMPIKMTEKSRKFEN